jgi:molecular chaperone DnaK (HSP70)
MHQARMLHKRLWSAPNGGQGSASGVSEQPKVLTARDVTVMRIADGVFGVLSTTGDRNLGGFDMMDEALEDAGLSYADIDRVLLVGGSTRMPMVGEPVTRVTGAAGAVG